VEISIAICDSHGLAHRLDVVTHVGVRDLHTLRASRRTGSVDHIRQVRRRRAARRVPRILSANDLPVGLQAYHRQDLGSWTAGSGLSVA